MNIAKVIKVALMILPIVYCLSPIDACPGPIDDIIVLLVSHALGKGVGRLWG